jgi:hypothetical protein
METVKFGIKSTEGNSQEEMLSNWSDELIKVLGNPKEQEQIRKVMQKGVKNAFTFEGLADDWREIWSR